LHFASAFTPSKQSTGRRLLEARRKFRRLRTATMALPLTYKLLKKLDQNFLLYFNKIENFRAFWARKFSLNFAAGER
jgi:hypothetical protein